MASDIRHQAVEALPDGDAPWMDGGTYMAFLRITVDLAQWPALPRTSQEAIVGRDKLTGAPLESVLQRADGSLEVMLTAGCPFNGGLGPAGADPQDCIDPLAAGGEPIVAASHIHRSNLRRLNDPGQDAGNRIFRQGYEFLEMNAGKRIEAGLNFVGFTRRISKSPYRTRRARNLAVSVLSSRYRLVRKAKRRRPASSTKISPSSPA